MTLKMTQKERLEALEDYVAEQFVAGADMKAVTFKALKGSVSATVVTLNADGKPIAYHWLCDEAGEIKYTGSEPA